MSLITDSLRAGAVGAVTCCVVYAAMAATAPDEFRIGIDNFTFSPESVTVRTGTKVVWNNGDDIPHSIVETTGKFHSAALDTDDRFSLVFDQAGTYAYFCGLHPHMKGTVVVSP